MPKFKFVQYEQGSPEWLAYRRKGIGASDIPSIIECDGAYKTKTQLIESKLGRDEIHNDYTKMIFAEGHAIEEIVRTEAESQLGQRFFPCVIESVQNPQFFASLDGMSEDGKRIIEVKSTKKHDFVSMVRSGICPPVYYFQIQWQLMISGLDECTLIVVDKNTGDRHPLIVEREDAMIESLKISAEKFLGEFEGQMLSPKKEIAPNDNDAMMLESVLVNLQDLKQKVEYLENLKEEYAQKLLSKYGATKLENEFFKIQTIEKVGSVNYKQIPELKGVNLDQYRGKSSQYIKVSTSKGDSK